ncbi:MAG: hypothetical protein NVS1B6_07460 [Steroidobacteraceae bacterium]
MKHGKFTLFVSAVALAFCLQPNVGWSTRLYAPMITGEVTAAPQSGAIEIAHHVYQVKPNSEAAKALSGFHAGQNVDIVLDGPANSAAAQVISITLHPRT